MPQHYSQGLFRAFAKLTPQAFPKFTQQAFPKLVSLATTLSIGLFLLPVLDFQAIKTPDIQPTGSAIAQEGGQPNLATYQVYDQTFNMPAAAFLYPAGWNASGEVQWNLEHFSQPVRMHAAAISPDGLSQVEFLPAEQFCWLVPNPGFKSPGQSLGDGSTLLPPVSAGDILVRFEIPKWRGNIANLQIVEVRPMPELGSLLGMQNQGDNQEGACVRLNYEINGQPIEEEIYGLKVTFNGLPSYGAAGRLMQYNWGLAKVFAFRTPAGQMESARPYFAAVIKSGTPNPQWLTIKQQMQQKALQHNNFRLLLTKQSIDNANRLSQIVIAGQEQFFAQQAARRDSEWISDHQKIQDRYNDGTGGGGSTGTMSRTDAVNDMLGGQETYNDPAYAGGSVHDGYHSYMWTDGQGNYRPSNDPNFNPNINSGSTWTLMQKKQ